MAFPVIQITYESCGICREILAWGRDKGLGVVESIEWWARYSNDTIRSIGRKRNFLPQRDSYGTWSLETVFHDHICPIECKSYLTETHDQRVSLWGLWSIRHLMPLAEHVTARTKRARGMTTGNLLFLVRCCHTTRRVYCANSPSNSPKFQ